MSAIRHERDAWYCPGCKVLWTDENDLQQVQPDGHGACPICEDRDDLQWRPSRVDPTARDPR